MEGLLEVKEEGLDGVILFPLAPILAALELMMAVLMC